MYKVDTYFYESVDKYAKEEYTNTVVKIEYRGVEQLAARRAHNPKVVSSSLTPATKRILKPRNHNGYEVLSFLTIYSVWKNDSLFVVKMTVK